MGASRAAMWARPTAFTIDPSFHHHPLQEAGWRRTRTGPNWQEEECSRPEEEVDMWHWYGMQPWGWISMAVFWVAIVALVVWGVRSSGGTARPDPDQAMRILEERFARGEIDQQEYEERRRVLENNRRKP